MSYTWGETPELPDVETLVILFIYLKFTHLFLAMLSLSCCAGFSLVMARGGCSLAAVRGLLILGAFPVAEPRL